MSKKYKIGQVLYVISHSSHKVIPVQVLEIQRTETIEGEEISYMVADPSGENLYDLLDIEGEIFIDHKEVSSKLKENANKRIDEIVAFALKVAKDKFNVSEDVGLTTKKTKKKVKLDDSIKESEEIDVDLSENDSVEIMDKNGKPVKAKIGKISYSKPTEEKTG